MELDRDQHKQPVEQQQQEQSKPVERQELDQLKSTGITQTQQSCSDVTMVEVCLLLAVFAQVVIYNFCLSLFFFWRSTKEEAEKNHLGQEKSPYLLQHADNPVHWFAFSQKAFEIAKKLNRPILISIGYGLSCYTAPTHTHIYLCVYVYKYIYTQHIHTEIYIYIYIYTHTQRERKRVTYTILVRKKMQISHTYYVWCALDQLVSNLSLVRHTTLSSLGIILGN